MIPEILLSQYQAYTIDTFRHLTGDEFPFSSDLAFQHDSLETFVQNIKSSDVFEQLIRWEWKNTDPFTRNDLRRLDIQYLQGYGHIGLGPFDGSQFYLDGQFGMALVDRKHTIGACISFDHPSSPRFQTLVKNTVPYLLNHGYLRPDDLVITQLQGALESWKMFRKMYNQKTESPLIDSIRWELALTDLTCLWALKNGYERIFMLSADQCVHFYPYKYSDDSERREKYQRGKMRYDVTARRLGFSKDEQTDFWVKDLAQFHIVPVTGLFGALLKPLIRTGENEYS